jgi:Uma2 family endonuclease
VHALHRLTPDQYLEIERASEFRNEYCDGRMYAKLGGSHAHAIIIGNLAFELRKAVAKGACLVTSSDLRVRVSPQGLYTYPDVVVVCDSPQYADGRRDTLLNPVLVIEVLSRTSEAYDRGFKSAQYRTLKSLQEYALASQAEPRMEVFRRQRSGDWLLSESIDTQASCRLESIGCSIALSDLYDKVTFEDAETARNVDSEPLP